MTTTPDMNTPVQTTKNNSINENKQEYFDKLQAQLAENQLRRIRGRNYGRILREYNIPAEWYKASSIPRSVYFYDPQYQKYFQQQLKSPINNTHRSPSPNRVTNQSKSHTKSPNSSNNSLQKQKVPSRLQSVPKLPPIIIHKK